MIKFVIDGRFPSLNEYIKAERTNRYIAANMKQSNTELVQWVIKSKVITKPTLPVWVSINWYEPNNKRDIDNITWAKKFIMDGMQKAGLIPNDNRTNVVQTIDKVYTDTKNPRVEVVLYEGGVPFE